MFQHERWVSCMQFEGSTSDQKVASSHFTTVFLGQVVTWAVAQVQGKTKKQKKRFVFFRCFSSQRLVSTGTSHRMKRLKNTIIT